MRKKVIILIMCLLVLASVLAFAFIYENKQPGDIGRNVSSEGVYSFEGIDYTYKYSLQGRMNNAVNDSCFVVLSNREDVSFEEAARSLFGSDYHDTKGDFVVIELK